MVEISQIRVSQSRVDGAKNSGGDGNHLDAWEDYSGEKIFDSDLRWVPPRYWEEIFRTAYHGRLMSPLNVADTGTFEGYDSFALFPQLSPVFQRLLSNKDWRSCINNILRPNGSSGIYRSTTDTSSTITPMSIDSEELEANNAVSNPGGGGGNGVVQPWFPAVYCYVVQW